MDLKQITQRTFAEYAKSTAAAAAAAGGGSGGSGGTKTTRNSTAQQSSDSSMERLEQTMAELCREDGATCLVCIGGIGNTEAVCVGTFQSALYNIYRWSCASM